MSDKKCFWILDCGIPHGEQGFISINNDVVSDHQISLRDTLTVKFSIPFPHMEKSIVPKRIMIRPSSQLALCRVS